MTQWKEPAVPRHVIQMLVIDNTDKVLIMHRSDKVRSAKNVWSIPTGTHDIGETVQECAFRELEEEFGLIGLELTLLDQYENIAGDAEPPHYHWILSVYGILVDDVTKAINREPDRHDKMEFVDISNMNLHFFDEHPFHESFHKIIQNRIHAWHDKLPKDC